MSHLPLFLAVSLLFTANGLHGEEVDDSSVLYSPERASRDFAVEVPVAGAPYRSLSTPFGHYYRQSEGLDGPSLGAPFRRFAFAKRFYNPYRQLASYTLGTPMAGFVTLGEHRLPMPRRLLSPMRATAGMRSQGEPSAKVKRSPAPIWSAGDLYRPRMAVAAAIDTNALTKRTLGDLKNCYFSPIQCYFVLDGQPTRRRR
jgi:hypothetical protein